MKDLKETRTTLKSLKIQNLLSKMASLFSRWQNCKERPNQSTNNEDIDEIANRPVSE